MFRNAASTADTEPRDTVQEMQHSAHDLSFNECEAWMRELGYLDGGKPDWDRLLREAHVGTDKAMLKMRWNKGKSPVDRGKVRAKLIEAETKRKEHTATGMRILGLEEWNDVGLALASEPEIFSAELERLKRLAAPIRAKQQAKASIAAADAEIAAQMGDAFGSITPKPKGSRK